MSRAFVKEDGLDNAGLPDLPISPHPNYVTARGLAALHTRLAETQNILAGLKMRPDRMDRLPEAAAERDIRYLEARLRSAILTEPVQDAATVGFGSNVTVEDELGASHTYRIVGGDEADATQGWIAPHSPLARALIGAEIGDVVEWRRPAGVAKLEVVAISADAG